jgi:hypothetical protein
MTTGTATYKGLAIPLYGDFETKQGTAGTDHATFSSVANATASNIVRANWTSTSALTTGYSQGSYVNMTLAGGITGGSVVQASAFATDISLSGAISGWVTGMYVYVGEGTTAVPADPGLMDGVCVFFDTLGSGNFAYRAGFHAYSQEASAQVASLDAAFMCECAGAAGTWGAFLGGLGISAPEYFLEWQSAPGDTRMFVAGYSPTGVSGIGLRCYVNGTAYVIMLNTVTS